MTEASTVKAGYVITEDGTILVQIPDPDSRWGFCLSDSDGDEYSESWDGGFGAASSWELISDDDPRITDADRERLGWILEDHR
jgi:hypothetical protein